MSSTNNNNGKKPRWSHADKAGAKRGQDRSGGRDFGGRRDGAAGGRDERRGGFSRDNDRREGGFRGGDERRGGFQARDDRRDGGFRGRDERRGGFNRDNDRREGGFRGGDDRRGGFNRGSDERRGGFQGRDDRRGGFSRDNDRREGGFRGGDDRRGGFNRDNDRRDGGFRGDDRRGGFNRGGDDRRGGFGGRDDRREGGFQRRDDRGGFNRGGDDRRGGFNRDNDRREGGFRGGDDRRGGFNRDDRRGGYQGRDDRRGGFNRDNDRREGGFQRRDDRGGFNRGDRRDGGFQRRDDRREGGFDREKRFGRPDRSFDDAPVRDESRVEDAQVENVTAANADVAATTVEADAATSENIQRENVDVVGEQNPDERVHVDGDVEGDVRVDDAPTADATDAERDGVDAADSDTTNSDADNTDAENTDPADATNATAGTADGEHAGFDESESDEIDESVIMTFTELGLPEALVERMARDGITKPFPIQAATIPDAMAGKDVLGRGRTGSGKTLGFGLPMLARLAEGGKARAHQPRAIVLVPTRELAMQVSDALQPLVHVVGLKHKLVAGGMPYEPQLSALERGVDVLIATPGRLSDLIERGAADLSRVEIAVLDEADHMAEMGFLEAITEILDLVPEGGQRLLFSATLDRGIDTVVDKYLVDPVTHSTDDGTATVTTMEHHALLIEPRDKKVVTAEVANREGRTVVFVRTKMGADRVAAELREQGVMAAALHGGLNQGQRNRVLSAFKDGRVPVLVATDVAARGIHVDEVGVVLQVDPPADHKDYLHRAGRTARAGEKGTVITLALPHQRRSMQRLLDSAGVDVSLVRTRPGDEAIVAAGGSTPEGRSISEDDLRRTLAPRNDRGGRGGRGYERGGRGGYDRGGRDGGRGGYGRGGGFDRGGRGRFNDRDDRGQGRGRGDDRGFGGGRGYRDDIDGGFERENRRQSFGGRGGQGGRGGYGGDRGGYRGNRD